MRIVAVMGVALVSLAAAVVLVSSLGQLPRPPASTAPAPRPAATAGDGWTVSSVRSDGTPVRWDPCTPITWTTRAQDPEWFRDLVREAVDRIDDPTGLGFREVAPVDDPTGSSRRLVHDDAWAPVLVTLSDEGETPWLTGDVVGVAAPVAVNGQYVTAQVVFDGTRQLSRSFEDRQSSWGAAILHELGHLVGLGHVDDPDELMHQRALPGPADFGAGDLRGLAHVDGFDDCLAPPPPRDGPWPDVQVQLPDVHGLPTPAGAG